MKIYTITYMEQETSKIGNSDKSQTGVDYIWEHMCMLFLWHDGIPDELQDAFNDAKQIEAEQQKITEDTSDGYHTFKILYEIRKAYNVALFNEWAINAKYNVHKSRKHYDGEYPFGSEDWFIVCAELPSGQISNHYELKDWDLFKIPTKDKGLYPFDGHTTQDVINRLKNI